MKVEYLRARTDEEKAEAKHIKSILVHIRREMGLSQEDVAKLIGVNKLSYNRIENDFKRFNGYIQDKVCEALYLPKPKIFEKGL